MKIDQNQIKITIVDSKSLLESKLYHSRHPNLESEFELTTTNQFEMANCLSLIPIECAMLGFKPSIERKDTLTRLNFMSSDIENQCKLFCRFILSIVFLSILAGKLSKISKSRHFCQIHSSLEFTYLNTNIIPIFPSTAKPFLFNLLFSKFRRLGFQNRIVDNSDFKLSNFEHPIWIPIKGQ